MHTLLETNERRPIPQFSKYEIDTNGFINRYILSKKLSDLNTQKDFYKEEIENISLDKDQFESDDELLEKFAREEYFMKKSSEEIFYIEKTKLILFFIYK